MRTANTKIKTLTQRGRLAARTAPYFNTIAPRRLLGYLKLAGEHAAGRWLVQVEVGRSATGAAQRRRETLGIADDIAQANGTDVLSYEQALAKAIAWKPSAAPGGEGGAFTVRQAIERHRTFSGKDGKKPERNRKVAHDTLRRNVLLEESDGTKRPGWPGLADTPVAALTTEMLVAWRDALIRHDLKATDERGYEASRATAQRIWTNFRSALNQAYYARKKLDIPSPAAWRDVRGLGKVGNKREIHFSPKEVLRIIDALNAANDAAFADLCEAGFLTGARYGELCALEVRHFDARLGMLSIPDRSEVNRCKTGSRIVTLTPEAVEFFKRMAAGRLRSAPLLSPDGTSRWDAVDQSRRIKQALLATGCDAETVFYALRHSCISRTIESGKLPMNLIEKNFGTSYKMIKEYYAKSLAATERARTTRCSSRCSRACRSCAWW